MDKIEQFIREYNLQTLGGSNHFKANEFEGTEWSAPVIQQPDHLQKYIEFIGLIGVEIKEIAIVEDYVDDLGDISICSLYPNRITDGDNSSRKPIYEIFDDNKTLEWLRQMKYINLTLSNVWHPVILISNQGSFEIDYSESSSVRISKDCIPPRFYQRNPDASASYDIRRLFACLKGDIITDCSIKEQTFDEADFDFTGSYGIYLDENASSYIHEFSLLLKSGRRLSFSSDFDWSVITLFDNEGIPVKIPTKQIHRYLKAPLGAKVE